LDGLRFVNEIRNLHREVNIVVLLDTPESNGSRGFPPWRAGNFARSDSFQALCKCILCVSEGQVWGRSVEIGYVLDALVEPLPIEPAPCPVRVR